MKRKVFYLVVPIYLLFIACNKDDDIIIDNTDIIKLDYKVIEYLPAPGQYINDKASGNENISSMQEANNKALKRLSEGLYVSLGSWGGYIVIKFDNPIMNTGDYDFAISSNSFDTSSEPGIVWVMQDKNRNGIPDDEWFELKGSYFGMEGYERNYWVTYYRPDAKGNTPWSDSNGETGVINWLGNYHSQDYYYPEWVKEDSYTLYGSRLPLLAIQDTETGNWTNPPYEWGYADNFGMDFVFSTHQNLFRISNAVNNKNESVNLPSIDFIKVQSAVNGSAGWLGDISTEVSGFFSLN